jgi:hypothetical protein
MRTPADGAVAAARFASWIAPTASSPSTLAPPGKVKPDCTVLREIATTRISMFLLGAAAPPAHHPAATEVIGQALRRRRRR